MALHFKISVDDKGNPALIRLASNTKKAGEAVSKFGTTFKSVFGAQALLGALRRFQVALMGITNVFVGFGREMSRVKALTSASGAEFRKLEAHARRLGETTVFTARESAAAFSELGRLGFKTNQILAASGPILDAAAASGEEMADVAQTAAGSLRAFGLSADETGRIADVMADSFRTSALNLERWSDSMKMAAPVARLAGVPMEEMASSMSVLANNMIIGSRAGTGMRRILIELSSSTSKAGKALGGASLETHTLTELFEMLKRRGFGVTAMQELFGKRAFAAATVLSQQSESVKKLNEQYKKSGGSAKEMADIMIDNIFGAFTLLKSASEGLVIAFMDAFGDNIQRLLKQFTKGVTFLKDNIEILQNAFRFLIGTILGVGEAVLSVIVITKTYALMIIIINAIRKAFLATKAAILAVRAAIHSATVVTKLWAVAQRVLNFVIKANPIGLLAGLLTALAITIIPAVILGFDKFKEILFNLGKLAKAVGLIILGAVTFDIGRIRAGFEDFKNIAFDTFGKIAEEAKKIGKDLAIALGFKTPEIKTAATDLGLLPPLPPPEIPPDLPNVGLPSESELKEVFKTLEEVRLGLVDKGQALELEKLDTWYDLKLELLERHEIDTTSLTEFYGRRRSEIQKKHTAIFIGAIGRMVGAVGDLAHALGVSGKELKAIRMVETVINTAAGIMQAWALPFPLSVITAATVGLTGAAQLATISSANFARGGVVEGPGNGTSDNVRINASRGERVLSIQDIASLGGNQKIQNAIDFGDSGGGGTVIIQGSIIGEEEHIRDKVIPILQEEASRI